MRISHTQHDAVSAAKTVEPLQHTILEAIRQFDTCTIANAIEHFRVRLRNEGFTRPGLRSVTGGAPRLIGYAATCRMRSADPPMSGHPEGPRFEPATAHHGICQSTGFTRKGDRRIFPDPQLLELSEKSPRLFHDRLHDRVFEIALDGH